MPKFKGCFDFNVVASVISRSINISTGAPLSEPAPNLEFGEMLENDPRYGAKFKQSTAELFESQRDDLLLKGECDPRFARANKLTDAEIRKLNQMNILRKVTEAQPEIIDEQPSDNEKTSDKPKE